MATGKAASLFAARTTATGATSVKVAALIQAAEKEAK